MKKVVLGFFLIFVLISNGCFGASQKKYNNVLVLTERFSQHRSFVLAALPWLNEFGEKNNFIFTEINHASEITEELLKKYDVFVQLDYPPYGWGSEAEAAFIKYMEEGKIGWIGFHHASLLGEFDGQPMWNWFSDFMGEIRFKDYIAETASAIVHIEDEKHPVMKGIPTSFSIPNEEWYTFDKNPREKVHVLASVDESTYRPDSDIKMGDHPVIWTNTEVKTRNVYFLIGHADTLFTSDEFKKMFSNALLWAVEK